MKHILIIIIAHFSTITFYSQNFENLKKLDTIYIPYHGKKNEKKHDIQTRITPTNFKEKSYTFDLSNENINFYHVQFKGWEKKDANIESEFRKVNKAFLKKNNLKIINPDSLNQYNSYEINCEIFTNDKVFYILDFTEKKRKIMLYEAIYMGHCPGVE